MKITTTRRAILAGVPASAIAALATTSAFGTSLATNDPLLTLLRRHEAADAAFVVAADAGFIDEAAEEAAGDALFRWSHEIVRLCPPATTATGALAALDHVLADDDLWFDRHQYPGLQMLWLLTTAARDYIAATAPMAVQS